MTSLLGTDGYKLSMAEAGYPLRRETFYYTHRRGGAQVWPFDAQALVASLVPTATDDELGRLAKLGYPVGEGVRAAFREGAFEGRLLRRIEVRSLPKGAWFLPGEPVLSITAPSALASWLEPRLLMASWASQIATLAKTAPADLAEHLAVVPTESDRERVRALLDELGVPCPPIEARPDAIRDGARRRAAELVACVGDASRIFEVGLRAAVSIEHHRLVLEGCREAGVTRTSHVALAEELGLIAVGTMGHEHVQRFGSDEAAFRAMKERRSNRSSFLLDTFDTLRSGLPAALRVMAEDPGGGDSVRYDSGDKEAQLREAHARSTAQGLSPVHVLEDGFDREMTIQFERVREELGIPRERLFYGYGGFLVGRRALSRDAVAAVYKVSQSGTMPVMKFSDDAGKRSIPGEPVVFRRVKGDGPDGLIGQHGEAPPAGYVLATGAVDVPRPSVPPGAVAPSAASAALVARCEARRKSLLEQGEP